MDSLFTQALSVMEKAFRRMEEQVPPPQAKPWKDGFVFRYSEQSIQQALALTNDTITDLHKQYLEAFYAEEFDKPEDPAGSMQSRNLVPRKKIRAYITRVLGTGLNPSRTLDVGETISKAYSGFIHAASPHIMDMCGGAPPRFFIAGMLGTPRVDEHRQDAWNYFYRSLLATTFVAKALGDKPLVDSLYTYIGDFERESGTNFSGLGKTET